MDLIFDPGLVLYLPFYELDGASFMSRDKHGHLCTVTGALWTPRGRNFDGSDDRIEGIDITSINGGSQITLECWVKYSDAGLLTPSSWALGKGDVCCIGGGWNDHLASFYIVDSSPAWQSCHTAAPVIDDGAYHHLVGTMNGTILTVYVDGVQSVQVTKGNGILNTSTRPVVVGCNNLTPGAYDGFWKGIIGEARIYTRGLSPIEIRHNYLATKWRYR